MSGIEPSSMFKLSYGLYVLTAREGNKDNGCIINTAIQAADNPKRISVTVNKLNYTHDMIARTGMFNISVLDRSAPFEVFKHFGFQSGRDVDKFAGCETDIRSDNGVKYIPKYTNAFMSGRVISTTDCGSHTMFLADVTEAAVLSSERSLTYRYYFENIKPKPQPVKKKGFVCKICGYIYEGETLPPDFICPVCKHGADDFEPLV